MRKLLLSLTAFAVALVALAQDHSTDPNLCYLTEKEVPSSLSLLPCVPADTTARFAYDHEQYEWGKTMRQTPRGQQAIADAYVNSTVFDRVYAKAFGRPITAEDSPVLYKLLHKARYDAGDLGTAEAKKHYRRTRPFVRWNEHTSVPDTEKDLINNGSYPSGHSAIGWCSALILANINPERNTEILKCGYEYGQSRVIVGAHYQSDVDAGRIIGAAVFSALMANPEFIVDLAAARDEFLAATLTKSASNASRAITPDSTSTAEDYLKLYFTMACNAAISGSRLAPEALLYETVADKYLEIAKPSTAKLAEVVITSLNELPDQKPIRIHETPSSFLARRALLGYYERALVNDSSFTASDVRNIKHIGELLPNSMTKYYAMVLCGYLTEDYETAISILDRKFKNIEKYQYLDYYLERNYKEIKLLVALLERSLEAAGMSEKHDSLIANPLYQRISGIKQLNS